MAKFIECEVWIIVDESGDYAASDDEAHVRERFEEVIGELGSEIGYRRVKVTVKVPVPGLIELAVEAPAEAEAAAVV